MNHQQILKAIEKIVNAYSNLDKNKPLTKAQLNGAYRIINKFKFFDFSVSKGGNLMLIGHEQCVVIGRQGRAVAQWGSVAQATFVGHIPAGGWIKW